MSIYKPTWLYIKQHNTTKLKYFGKTVRDPFKYNGSGSYWKRHIKKYGKDINTLWTKLFHSEQELTSFALSFSLGNNITESPDWANLRLEDGLVGGNNKGVNKGIKRSDKTKRLLAEINSKPNIERYGVKKAKEISKKKSAALKGRIFTKEHRKKLSEVRKGHKFSTEHCANISKSKKGKPWSLARRMAQRLR
jgi:hypothetical protein